MPSSKRVMELEALLQTIRRCSAVLLDVDMWDRWGSSGASPQERETREGEAARARTDQLAARSALEALVARTRQEAPAEIAAWTAAHDAHLAAFIAAHPGSEHRTARYVAEAERAGWADVRAGSRAFVDENCFYLPAAEL